MATRRSRGIPPLEVMGRRSADHQSPTQTVPDATDSLSRGPDDYPSHRGDLWSRAQQPMVLRVPRGLVVLIIAGTIGLFVLSYSVGHSRGASAALATFAEGQEPGRARPSAPRRSGVDGGADLSDSPGPDAGLPAENTTYVDLQANPLGVDTREVGLNYYNIAMYDRETAERLIQFLYGHGVESCAVPLQNGRLFQVVDLLGIEPGRVGDLGKKRKDLLMQLGKSWKKDEKGPGDLSDAWAEKYTGR